MSSSIETSHIGIVGVTDRSNFVALEVEVGSNNGIPTVIAIIHHFSKIL